MIPTYLIMRQRSCMAPTGLHAGISKDETMPGRTTAKRPTQWLPRRYRVVVVIVALSLMILPVSVNARGTNVTSRYFPDTGQWAAHGFLHYWEQFGGVPVFGYPLTGEFQENGITVQYFERARFEWHPGSGTPYDVLLGLLGDEVATTYHLRDLSPAFHPGQPKSNCTHFPETQHNLCGSFRVYWEAAGGLNVFGYPISEEFADPISGVTTQYFERTRFDLHPGAWPEHSDVLLGRLGHLVLAAHRLSPPEGYAPAAGVCPGVPGDLVTVEMHPDVPVPRCSAITETQRLRVVNATDQVAEVRVAPFTTTLAPGEAHTFDTPFGNYLAPGVHTITMSVYPGSGGAELWLKDAVIP